MGTKGAVAGHSDSSVSRRRSDALPLMGRPENVIIYIIKGVSSGGRVGRRAVKEVKLMMRERDRFEDQDLL